MRKNPKLPKGARRVFRGEIFDVYHWKQKVYDGSIQTYEMLARQDTVVVFAITPDKKIVVQRQSQPQNKKPFPSLPGGRVDDHETPLAAAKRELREETGYTATSWKLWKVKRAASKIDWYVYTFVAKDAKRTAKQSLDVGERITVRELSFPDFFSMSLKGDFGRDLAIETLQAKLNQKKFTQLKKRLSI